MAFDCFLIGPILKTFTLYILLHVSWYIQACISVGYKTRSRGVCVSSAVVNTAKFCSKSFYKPVFLLAVYKNCSLFISSLTFAIVRHFNIYQSGGFILAPLSFHSLWF